MATTKGKKPIIMVSSTVYGIEELLDRIYAVLTQFGYEVWSSHAGTMPTNSAISAFDNCIQAVKDCDLFLGLITPYYGSGVVGADISITHKELSTAIELNKPRWLLAHDHVVFARKLLEKLGHDDAEKRAALPFEASAVLDDLRVIDMYETAIRNEVRFRDRTGNWVQKFVSDEDALRYATAQFYRFQEVERFLEEQLANPRQVMERVEEDRS
ncbi:DUF4062 domain-containing protein [Sphingomonas faeni]|jgi:hypothetical protein|uniref:DUF4062 domain-containing protein n=1 Tax=Sphingomonas faeni TaxID=185950 RepID=UPI00335998C4